MERGNSKIPQRNLDILEKGVDIPSKNILYFEDKNKLLYANYLESENGFHHFEDGSILTFPQILEDFILMNQKHTENDYI